MLKRVVLLALLASMMGTVSSLAADLKPTDKRTYELQQQISYNVIMPVSYTHLDVYKRHELYPYKLWKLAPAGTLEDIYEEITDNPRLGKLRLIEMCIRDRPKS